MDYTKPPEPADGLRLHLNENTGGCSPRVLEAIRALTPTSMSFYPDYSGALAACADALGVDASWIALTNGLDEGIWAAAAACLRVGDANGEAVVPQPAFDMYEACVEAAGSRVVRVAPGPGLAFARAAVLDAIGPRTRIVYLCSPHNPSGLAIPGDDLEAVANALPSGALLFLDEAYVDFARGSFLPRLADFPNVIVGRTFAKAYGLAALRIGCLVAQPATLAAVQRMIPPYNLNVCAVEGLRAALADREHYARYCAQVAESRELIYDACRRLGFDWWPSEANFVLVRVGPRATALVGALARRGVAVRDRSSEPGCEGCIRITAGIADHTRACLAALEEAWCESR